MITRPSSTTRTRCWRGAARWIWRPTGLCPDLYAAHRPGQVNGLILSGLPHRERMVSPVLGWFSMLSLFTGDAGEPPLLNKIAFTRYNRGFEAEPASDGRYLWLTNDISVRYAFAADERCSRNHPLRDYRNLLRLVRDFWRPSSWEKPGKIPVLILAGERDPVSGGERRMTDAAGFLADMGYPQPLTRMYRGMRHEIFMDTEREVPFTDTLRFILNRLPKRASAPAGNAAAAPAPADEEPRADSETAPERSREGEA